MDRSVFELFRLDGKVAIVTGAHAWLGYDIACAFAEAGADVIITYPGTWTPFGKPRHRSEKSTMWIPWLCLWTSGNMKMFRKWPTLL